MFRNVYFVTNSTADGNEISTFSVGFSSAPVAKATGSLGMDFAFFTCLPSERLGQIVRIISSYGNSEFFNKYDLCFTYTLRKN